MNRKKITKDTIFNHSLKILNNNWYTKAIWNSENKIINLKSFKNLRPISIGVIDSFNYDDEDFLITNDILKFNNPYNINTKYSSIHGIPVSSVIFSLNPNIKLHAYPFAQYFTSYLDYAKYYSNVLINMIKNEGIKIINLSICFAPLNVIANNCLKDLRNEKPKISALYAQNALNKINNYIEKTLVDLITEGYDFLLIKCAGNNSNIRIFQANSLSFGFTTSNNVSVYEDEDYLISKTSVLKSYWDFFSGISNPLIKEKIIVVGSTNFSNSKYYLSKFSNFDDRVDLLAPGENINALSDNGNLINFSGTSFSAPIVTALCSLLWQINPKFKSHEIKEIITKSADIPILDYFNTNYILSKKMVNFVSALNSI